MAKKTKKKKSAKPAAPQPPAKGLLADVRNLMEMMASHDVTEIDLQDGARKIALKRGDAAVSLPVASTPATGAPAEIQREEPAPAETLLEITSPMVGTFYTASSPDSEPYVDVGAKVGANTVVCIVEAMKVMNEIKAEVSGTIAEICVKNAQPVEFGQVLFRVQPA